ncbi:polyadenylate binding protein [Rozella allomycis CSF55]|uniref:Glucose-6-phosphate 1-dehydrogenase n=1 Tax=Rozella allomycis (strain CSF55) TaxID=988480 RepID=A0A075ATD6_ROZAC|nr:Polyadenylate binding protein domain-containing protein [Rozella allomycis CSF55]RKP22011.1 polyadenylate binding protein [Rozella allomycis CSF55]|eukprot:EPZ31985.1 Polyadenylate binding protein domain-containing protein [Rozella allomycis CSF55]
MTSPLASSVAAVSGTSGVGVSGPSSLYVGELSTDVTESMLYELFATAGGVASIRICRDAITRRSLGYAYVNFHNHGDAERALETLNYTEIKGKPCRVMWSQRDPSMRRTGAGNIFIKNLDSEIDTKSLHDTFSVFGEILSCKVVSDDQGSKGYGFVHFESPEAADAAIAKVNGMLLNGKKVFVGKHVPRKERMSKIDKMKAIFTNIYVKNLPESIESDEKFVEMFSEFGNVTSAYLARDENGKSKGFGFVNFENHEQAQMAVESLNDKEIEGKRIYVGRAQKKSEREYELRKVYEEMKMERINKTQGVNLYVKNLDDSIDDEKLSQEFSVFGQITSVKVMVDEKGNSKGFGFVCFSSPDEASKAVTEMHGRIIGSKPIYVAQAQRKEERRMQLQAQFNQRGIQIQPGMPVYPPNMYFAGGMQPAGFVFPPQMMNRSRLQQQRPQQQPKQYVKPSNRSSNPQQQKSNNPQQKRQMKFTSNVRNINRQENSNDLTLANLAAAPPAEQKKRLGDRLFPLIHAKEPELAPKITGILLEMDIAELLHLLESPEALNLKISEIAPAIREHLAQLLLYFKICMSQFTISHYMFCSHLFLGFSPQHLIFRQSHMVSIVVFGASGDLAKKKTFPALFQLFKFGYIPKNSQIIGFARTFMTLVDFHSHIKQFLKSEDDSSILEFLGICTYISGQYDQDDSFSLLNSKLLFQDRIFYFALPPSIFLDVGVRLKSFCFTNQSRVILEKPFGRDYESAKTLLNQLALVFEEKQMFRIDHYLGKEMVKNLLCLRFANVMFGACWNRNYIDNVQITFKERIGTAGRGGYFNDFGIIRDVMQNHLMQILSIVAMEKPQSLNSQDIRNEKFENVILGQYTTNGKEPGYLDDKTVPNGSVTPTYAAAVLFIQNDRWKGVPFILKCGKAEVRIQFKDVPGNVFKDVSRNELVLRVQPNEAVYLKLMVKKPGLATDCVISELDLSYSNRFKDIRIPDAYESLLLDVLQNDSSNFVRDDELLEAWRIFTPLLNKIENENIKPVPYEFGSRGPHGINEFISKYGFIYSKDYEWK